jgi:erythromycin esterase
MYFILQAGEPVLNHIRSAGRILILILFIIAISACSSQENATHTAVQNWLSQNASPVHVTDDGSESDDLDAIADFIGDTRLVCLGESRHDIREQCLFKTRLVKRLVEKEGFRVFILEESLAFARELDSYINGSAADPDSLFNQMGNWYIWDTEEMQTLLTWMRAYNEQASETERLHFYGCDIMHPEPSIEQIQTYLDLVDPEFSATFRTYAASMPVWDANIWTELMQRYAGLSPGYVDSLQVFWSGMRSRFADREKEYVLANGKDEYQWAKLQINSIIAMNDMFLLAGAGINEAGIAREHGMAHNLKWVLNKYPRETRMIHWAHNLHVGRSAFDMEMQSRPPGENLPTMIVVLEQQLEIDMLSIGFSSARTVDEQLDFQEAEPGMLDALLSEACSGPAFVNLNAASDNELVNSWLNSKQTMLTQGGKAKVIPAQMFDGIVFIPDATKTTASPRAQERFRSISGQSGE